MQYNFKGVIYFFILFFVLLVYFTNCRNCVCRTALAILLLLKCQVEGKIVVLLGCVDLGI